MNYTGPWAHFTLLANYRDIYTASLEKTVKFEVFKEKMEVFKKIKSVAKKYKRLLIFKLWTI